MGEGSLFSKVELESEDTQEKPSNEVVKDKLVVEEVQDDIPKDKEYVTLIHKILSSYYWELGGVRRVKVMVFNATFNNISVISWRSVLLVEETGENHWPVTSHWQTLSHSVVSSTPHHEWDSNWQL